jgi:hypothetical protein
MGVSSRTLPATGAVPLHLPENQLGGVLADLAGGLVHRRQWRLRAHSDELSSKPTSSAPIVRPRCSRW